MKKLFFFGVLFTIASSVTIAGGSITVSNVDTSKVVDACNTVAKGTLPKNISSKCLPPEVVASITDKIEKRYASQNTSVSISVENISCKQTFNDSKTKIGKISKLYDSIEQCTYGVEDILFPDIEHKNIALPVQFYIVQTCALVGLVCSGFLSVEQVKGR